MEDTLYSGHAPANPKIREVKTLPGPRAWPLIGNLGQLQPARIHRDMEAWTNQYGPLFRVWFARTPVLVVADHKLVGAVLRDRPEGFRRPSITAQVSSEMGGSPGVFLAEGSDWRDQRRMVMAALAPHAVKAYFPSLRTVALRLRERWQLAAAQDRAIALTADLKRYSVDIIAGLAFGTDVNTVQDGDNQIQRHLEVVLAAVARRSMAVFPYWRYVRLPADRRLDKSVAAMVVEIDRLILAARARLQADPERRTRPRNLLEAMLCAADDGDSGVDDGAVAGNVSTMLLAGEDTTANTIAWLLWLLHRHPEALEKARAEILHIVPDPEAATIAQMDALDYIGACAQEAMRLKPVAPFLPLEALRDTVVGDVRLAKGGLVWCVMRHDSVNDLHVSNASQFDPDRWLHAQEPSSGRAASMPFGAGPRTCPGRYLAILEIKLAMAMLLASFEIASLDTVDGGEPQERMDFTMAPVGLRMRLRTRAAPAKHK
jgi:cytochrome P450